MLAKLNCNNFFSRYINDTQSQNLSIKDKQKALISSIFLGIFTLGMAQLICKIALNSRCIKHKKPVETPLSFKEHTQLNPLVIKALEQCLAALNSMRRYDTQGYTTVNSLLELGSFVMPFDKKTALKFFEKAKQMDTLNLGDVERSLAVAKIHAATTPEEKIQIANSLKEKDIPFGLRHVAIDLAKDHLEKSLEIVENLTGYNRFYALAGIIKIVTPSNYELGLKLANVAATLATSFPDNGSEIDILLDVFFAKHDRKRAFELADAIVPSQRGPALIGDIRQGAFPIIGEEYANADLDGAINWANTLDNHNRIRVLCSMVKAISSTEPEIAKQLMEQALSLRSTNDIFESDKIRCIKTMALLDLSRALALLKEVERKAEALLGMIQILAPVNPSAALNLAALLFDPELIKDENPQIRFHLFMNLAKEIHLKLQDNLYCGVRT